MNMINLYLIDSVVCVFNVNDYIQLREQHRIIGKLSGINEHNKKVLPVIFLPEEVNLLVTKRLARLVCRRDLVEEPTDVAVKNSKKYADELFEKVQKDYKEKRKKELLVIIDKIVEGKHKKGIDLTKSKEEILQEELQKSCKITKDNMIWPISNEHYLQPTTESLMEIPLQNALQKTTKEKCKIFMDLWDKGYYVSSGNKFGGDFLVYLGDPLMFHAIFIIHCLKESELNIHPSDLTAKGRLSTSVKKKSVLSHLRGDEVIYLTLSWFDGD